MNAWHSHNALHMAPLVSVITPCYNAGPFLQQTIQTVRNQTYGAIEHIIVDDASTDSSVEKIDIHESEVMVLRLDRNRGGPYARNRGYERSSGTFILFLDADDLLSPDAVEQMVYTASSHADAITFCEWKRLEPAENGWEVLEAEVALPRTGDDHLLGWLRDIWVPPCAVLWPRHVYDSIGGWDESLIVNQDGDLMMRAFAAGAAMVRAEGGTAYYRRHEDGRESVSTRPLSAEALDSRIRVLESLTLDLRRAGRLKAYRTAIGDHYARLASRALVEKHTDRGHECLRRAAELGVRPYKTGTLIGSVLSAVIGMGRKEALARWLADVGLMTAARRRILAHRSLRESAHPVTTAES
jgi:O-antigen biosynthesis protein